MLQTIRSLAYLLGGVVFILIGAILVIPVFFSKKSVEILIEIWIDANLIWLKYTCNLTYKVTGSENIPVNSDGKQAAFIILSNHQSAWETIALPKVFNFPIAWVLKKGLLWVPFFGWGIASTKPIAINRSSGKKAIEQLKTLGKQRLSENSRVLIFPEGTRIPHGKLGKLKLGGSVLGEYSTYPIVPVVHNAGLYWPKRGIVKHPGIIKVEVGKPIETKGKTANEINAEVKQWMTEALARIS